ncbi:DUF4097 family beta strand repeat-containing protein [Weissella hellenica]|uniref:Adhesin n=1 Tax=Weissella hellenica TaxID=46256 RepID=A0A4Y4G3N5_WEIHE|nr:DUF4097 family beta strand repeat-containing protein [Weissella hellenica]NKY67300.1 DUF4097 domain-containing protein [Weissella hellenica]GED36333.1 hypothetical protein WHE01_12370 [Weissella hellenica]SCC02580.1 Putative adhesin [Weissella hellenica]
MGLKAALITGGSVMVVGGAMVVIGLSTGANTAITWDNGPKIVKTHKFNKTLADHQYKKLTINGGSNSVINLVQGDEWHISGHYTNVDQFNLHADNDDLKITMHDRDRFILGVEPSSQKLTITVPRGINLDQLSVRTEGSGIITKGISAKNVAITNYYGGVRLQSLHTNKISINGESSHYRLKDVNANQLYLTGDDTTFNADHLTLKEASEIKTDNSNIELNNVAVPGMKVINRDCDLEVNDKDQGETDYITGDQQKALKITGEYSAITINH